MYLLKMFFFILCEIIFDYEETSGVLWVKGSSGTWIKLNYRMVLKDSQNIVDIFLPPVNASEVILQYSHKDALW